MSSLTKWFAIVLTGIVALVLCALAYVYAASEIMLTRTYATTPARVEATTQPAAVARGAHLAQIYGCTSCHGDKLAGELFDELPLMRMWSTNLPALAKTASDADLNRGIRQGLRSDGTSVVLMPSNAFVALDDDEVGSIISYVRSLPVEGEPHPPRQLGPLVRAIMVFGLFQTAAEQIAAGKRALDVGRPYAAGRHLAEVACSECHGGDLSGAPAVGPMPARPDLAMVASYDKAEFVRFMRSGKAVGDRELVMMSATSRARFRHFTDEELTALYDYLIARSNALAETEK